jgi:hypothetical protein
MSEKASSFLSFVRSALAAPAAFAALAAVAGLAGCQPQIGDKCNLNTECAVSGTRQCDTSLPGGYCTVFNCGPNSCPDQSACYLFHAEVQGCPYNDHQPSRTAHSFCMKDCHQDGDCRAGYVCRSRQDLAGPPWDALLLDDNQDQKICVPLSDQTFASGTPDASPLVCQADPAIDAAFPEGPDAGPQAVDAAGETGTAPGDSGTADATADATLDAGVDATTPDATTLADAREDGSDAGSPDATID